MKKKTIIIVMFLLIAGAIAVILIKNKHILKEQNKVIDRSNVPVAVTTGKADVLPTQGNLIIPSVLMPNEEATISVPMQGRIETLKIELGTHITKGEIIGTIDTKQKQLNLQSTQLTVDKLEKDYNRNKELFQGKAINETAVIDSKYNYENNKVQADLIRQQIKDGNIIAPISGIISEKKLLPGEYVNSGTAIATVVDVSKMKAQVYINEKDVYHLQMGSQATVTTDIFPNEKFTGKVSFISPKGDENHNYKVELIVNNTGNKLKAGTYVKAEFDFGDNYKSSALQIPKIALVEGIKNPYVYVTDGSKVYQRKLVVGREVGENIEIISGLKVGETIVIDGQINLIEGSFIKIINNK